MRRTWLVVANVLALAALVVGSVVARNHLDDHIAAKKRDYGACALHTKPKLRPAKCGWAALGEQKDAVLYGAAFLVVALGLTDLLLVKVSDTRGV